MNSAGHPFGPGPVATISENSPRADAWRTIFGGLTAPIRSAVPQRCEIARTVSLVYWLDIGRIDSEMMDRLIAHAQAQSAGVVPHDQVRIALMAEGMPIRYEDVSVVTNEHPETIITGIEAEILPMLNISEHGRMRRSIDDAPALCSCLTDGTPLGPHCVHAREWLVRQDDGVQRVRKHGGAPACPRACMECPEGAHHFCEIDRQPAYPLEMYTGDLDEEEREEVESLRKHPAHLAGCESWYECRHCDAWIEASDDDDASDDEDDDCDDCPGCPDCECDDDDAPDSDDEPDSDDYDDEDDDGWNDKPDSVPLSVAMRGALIEPPTNDDQTKDQRDIRSVSVPSWAYNLARDILVTARFLNWVGVRVPNSIAVQWSAVIAEWPDDVRESVCAWLGPQAPGREQGPTRENAPTAVRALVDQATTNGSES